MKKKATTLFSILKTLITNPGKLRLLADREKECFNHIKKNYPEFSEGLPVIDFAAACKTQQETVVPYTFLGGNSLPTDLLLLNSLAKQSPNCSYFEIGTWRGESVANVARYAGNCYTLNLSDKSMQEMGLSENYIKAHRFFSKNLSNVSHLQGDSMKFDFSPYRGKIDLIFVDGDHHFHQVAGDTRNAFSMLKNENAVIVWHDYGFQPEEIRYEVLAGILEGCPKDKLRSLYQVSDTKCAIYTSTKFVSRPMKAYADPGHYFEVSIKEKKV